MISNFKNQVKPIQSLENIYTPKTRAMRKIAPKSIEK